MCRRPLQTSRKRDSCLATIRRRKLKRAYIDSLSGFKRIRSQINFDLSLAAEMSHHNDNEKVSLTNFNERQWQLRQISSINPCPVRCSNILTRSCAGSRKATGGL